MTDCIPQLLFSFYHHQPIRADFSGGQITSDAGLLPLRAFDQRHHLTRDWPEASAIPGDTTAYAMIRRRCCVNVSIRSWPGTKMPTTLIVYVTIPCCRSSPIANWAMRSARSPP